MVAGRAGICCPVKGVPFALSLYIEKEADMPKSNQWIKRYEERGALWIHDGHPQRPHALLTSGKHSDGFFNSELVMEDPVLLDEACDQLAKLYESYVFSQFGILVMLDTLPGRVVGPAMGAITLAHDMARHISMRQGFPCLRAYVEKEGEGKNKKMVFKRASIRPGERVLLVEDVLTSGESVELAADAVVRAGGVVLSYVAVLVNRSGLAEVNGKKIVALIDRPMHNWDPDECPLCAAGSEAIRPKELDNWARLNARYSEKGEEI
jgi:orotate phosphoribosyltransferase